MAIDVAAALANGMLTTYPDSADEEQLAAHEECLALEGTGEVVRHTEGVTYAPGALEGEGQRFVIWKSTGAPPPPPPDPDPEV